MSARLYGMLPAEGIRLSERGRSRPYGSLHRHDGPGVRAEVRLPHVPADAAAGAARSHLPVSIGGRLWNSPGQAYAVPHLSLLAGAGGEQARMEENRALLSRHRQGAADTNRKRQGAGGGDASAVSLHVQMRAVPMRAL